jgi:hypothetical protein
MSGPIRHEDAFVVGLQLRDFPHREYWEYGRLAPVCDLRAGETCIYDLKREPRGLLDKPYHTLFFLSAACGARRDRRRGQRVANSRSELYKPGASLSDVTVSSLGSLLLPALRHPNQANPLFVDHVLLAFGAHIAQTYGGMRRSHRLGQNESMALRHVSVLH